MGHLMTAIGGPISPVHEPHVWLWGMYICEEGIFISIIRVVLCKAGLLTTDAEMLFLRTGTAIKKK